MTDELRDALVQINRLIVAIPDPVWRSINNSPIGDAVYGIADITGIALEHALAEAMRDGRGPAGFGLADEALVHQAPGTCGCGRPIGKAEPFCPRCLGNIRSPSDTQIADAMRRIERRIA